MSVVLSMTGYASAQGFLLHAARGQVGFTLTIKSVNHRFLDLHLRLPAQSDALEMRLRRMLKDRLKRGHVEVTLQVERRASGQLELNAELLDAYVQAHREAAKLHGLTAEPDLNGLLRLPGMMSAERSLNPDDAMDLEEVVLTEMEPLLARLNVARGEEGSALAAELRGIMLRIRGYASELTELRGGVRDAQFERLQVRLAELMQGTAVSEERVLAEAAVMAEKSDIEEEIVRLRTHVDRFIEMLDAGGELGKRLDFLLQELNREANTLLSKTSGAVGSNSLRITELGLEMKAEIERAREQVQNLE